MFLYLQWASQRVALREATIRMMAGAAPAKTQQLLDKCLATESTTLGLVCGKGKVLVKEISSLRESINLFLLQSRT